MTTPTLPSDIHAVVANALAEDIGTGDLTAALLDPNKPAVAHVVTREPATLCGRAWFDEVFRQVDPRVVVTWNAADGDRIAAGDVLCLLRGSGRSMVTGERTALNFLQLLSGTATATRSLVDLLAGTGMRVLDTRKTLPGLRRAQKYAVVCGGGMNYRIGLFDAILIKENHIEAVGGVAAAVRAARQRSPNVMIEVEVETLEQLDEALGTDADRIMLDDFSLADMHEAVRRRNASTGRRPELEVSGSVSADTLRAIAATGVDFASVGALTKNVRAIDLSMRFLPSS
jgi:nicotinate-nucleotide pyrophosphorylase (carboxylating)